MSFSVILYSILAALQWPMYFLQHCAQSDASRYTILSSNKIISFFSIPLSCQPRMTPAFILPQQLIITLHLMVSTVTYPLPLHCCSASSHPFILECLISPPNYSFLHSPFSNFFLLFQAIFPVYYGHFKFWYKPPKCLSVFSSHCQPRIFIQAIYFTASGINEAMEKYRPWNKMYGGLTMPSLVSNQ